MSSGPKDRRLLVLLVVAMLALVAVTPRINRWLARDACRAQRGHWNAVDERCEASAP